MRLHRSRRLISSACFTILIALPSVWVSRHYKQIKLDHALIAAIKRSDVDAVDSLLNAGADPNARDTPEKLQTILQRLHTLLHRPPSDLSPTALVVAMEVRSKLNGEVLAITPHILTALLSNGADPNLLEHDDSWDYIDTSLYELDPQVRNPRLMIALDHKGPHTRDSGTSYTPLMVATMHDYTDCVSILLDHAAKPNPKPSYLTTPLSFAQGSGYKDIINLLKSHGAKE